MQTPTWHRHSDQHVCMVSEHLQGSTCDLSSSSSIMETEILYREGVVICTQWSYLSTRHALTVVDISNQSPCCLSTCEPNFRWTREMQNWALTQAPGTPEARPQRPKRPRGAQGQPKPDTEADATGLFVTKSKEGQRPTGEPHAYGWAATMTAWTTDTALSAEDKQKSGGIHVQRELTGDSPARASIWSQFKKTFLKDWVKWQCSVDSQTQPILCVIIKAMKARGAKEKFGQAPAGGNVCELQQMLDDL